MLALYRKRDTSCRGDDQAVMLSLHITLGQDYLPHRVGTAGGVTLGLTVSIGGVASPLIGAIADHASLQVRSPR